MHGENNVKSIALFEGSQPSPACPYGKSSIKLKLTMGHERIDTDRRKMRRGIYLWTFNPYLKVNTRLLHYEDWPIYSDVCTLCGLCAEQTARTVTITCLRRAVVVDFTWNCGCWMFVFRRRASTCVSARCCGVRGVAVKPPDVCVTYCCANYALW
jgi:hypothetical protein